MSGAAATADAAASGDASGPGVHAPVPDAGSDPVPAVALDGVRYAWPGDAAPTIDVERMRVAAGERVFVRGASGSGKTTLLGLIAATLRPQAGTVRVGGTDLNALSGTARDAFRAEHIGFVFQQFNLLPFLSVPENVELPTRFSPARRERATRAGRTLGQETERLLEAMRLPASAWRGRSAMRLSVGQQQRVAVARALIGAPALVIADEPTSALDVEAREAFVELVFAEVREAGSTLLFVSHDPGLASGFDRTVELGAER